jgi:hypothetical protein
MQTNGAMQTSRALAWYWLNAEVRFAHPASQPRFDHKHIANPTCKSPADLHLGGALWVADWITEQLALRLAQPALLGTALAAAQALQSSPGSK